MNPLLTQYLNMNISKTYISIATAAFANLITLTFQSSCGDKFIDTANGEECELSEWTSVENPQG